MPSTMNAATTPAAASSTITGEVSTRGPADQDAAASMMTLLRDGADVRFRKVRKVRAAVRVRAYENPLKLSVAIDRLIAVLES